jgi:hypothetical protein
MKMLIGLVAAAAGIYLVKTGKGKEILETLKKEAANYSDTLSGLLKTGASTVKSAAESKGLV